MKKKILAAALIVAVLLSISSVIAGQYREYGSQIEELQEGLADRERTIAHMQKNWMLCGHRSQGSRPWKRAVQRPVFQKKAASI